MKILAGSIYLQTPNTTPTANDRMSNVAVAKILFLKREEKEECVSWAPSLSVYLTANKMIKTGLFITLTFRFPEPFLRSICPYLENFTI